MSKRIKIFSVVGIVLYAMLSFCERDIRNTLVLRYMRAHRPDIYGWTVRYMKDGEIDFDPLVRPFDEIATGIAYGDDEVTPGMKAASYIEIVDNQ